MSPPGDDSGSDPTEEPGSTDDGDTGSEDGTTDSTVQAERSGAGNPSDTSGKRVTGTDGDTVVSRDEGDQDPTAEEEGRKEPRDWVVFVYDLGTSVLAVVLVGLFLFAVSGVWPPLVAVESGSMEPHMQVNDLVFVMEENRFPGDGAQAGVVTASRGQNAGFRHFGGYGDVIVYTPNGDEQRTPIIHRAMFWVESGDNWCRKANPAHLGGLRLDDPECTAEHSGFITKGDNNNGYDQARGLSRPVKPEWVVGTAEFRIPGLGWIRLQST